MKRNSVSYFDFWKSYLRDHSNPFNRLCHIAGFVGGLMCFVAAIGTLDMAWATLGLFCFCGLGWLGHLLFERTAPASLDHPLWSMSCDVRMAALFFGGRLGREMSRNLPRQGPASIGMYEPATTSARSRRS